jgi:hypothetical protein
VRSAVEPSGAAVFEAVPGREEYDSGEEGAAEWEKSMLEFADGNFNDAGIEVRSMDQRDRQVGLSSVTSWTAWAMASSWSGKAVAKQVQRKHTPWAVP